MIIREFDIIAGYYRFEVEALNATMHAHPVVEVISSSKATFRLYVHGQWYEDLHFAIINSNVKHQVESTNCSADILMFESFNSKFIDFLHSIDIQLDEDVFIMSDAMKQNGFIQKLEYFALNFDRKKPGDDRVDRSLMIMEQSDLNYKDLIETLKSKVFLSESRLSHLFKEHVGVSMKKYLVWCKLKKAIDYYLNEDTNLTKSSIEHGFFDQAHLSNAFKKNLGVSPSKAYNSRTLQF